MQYPVIVEQTNGVWRAVLPTLADLSAEGTSFDDAVQNARQAAEDYLAKVVVTSIEVNTPSVTNPNQRSPQNWIASAGMFKGDEATMWQHLEEIDAARRHESEKLGREYDRLEAGEGGA
jgi:predicted RNase H-like HicB family nuclease